MKLKTIDGYRNILRAIGQGLENLDVRSFQLEVSGSHYIVSGSCRKPQSMRFPIHKKLFFGLIQKSTLKESSPLSIFYFSQLRFTRSDLELLDRKGKVLRSDLSSHANFYSTSNFLRMVGSYLDHKGGRLLKLSSYRRILSLWYLNGAGIEVREIFTKPTYHLDKRQSHGLLKPVCKTFPISRERSTAAISLP